VSLDASFNWYGVAKDDEVVAALGFDVGYVTTLFAFAGGEEEVGLGDGLARFAFGAGEFLVDGCARLDEGCGSLYAIHDGVVSH
jgi:hypothetical protein